jgi:pimeloyl-ACP methyl ester carboxylesterase
MSAPGRLSVAELRLAFAAPRPAGALASRFRVVGGVRTHYRADREATAVAVPVVLVHGLAVSHRYLMPLATALSGWHPVIAPDRPGFGLSRPVSRVYTVEDNADHLARLLAGLGLGRACVLGHSYGATVAVALAARHPERVAALVLAGPIVDPAARSLARQVGRFVADVPREALAQGAILARDVWDAGPARVWRTLADSVRYDLLAGVSAVSAPTLVVGGGSDPIAPAAWRRRLVRLLPDARSVTVPGTAHNVATTAAPQVARAVVAFLQDRT